MAHMPLADELRELKARLEGKRAPEQVALMHRAVDELRASNAVDHALKVGDRAPEFTLPNAEQRAVSSRELLARGPLVVTFYRGRWLPYCNVELVALQGALPEITGAGAALVAISPQRPGFNAELVRQRHLTFEILSDAGNG